MELKIDAWGLIFESGVFDLYIQRSAFIGFAVIYAGLFIYKKYKARNTTPSKKPSTK